MNNDIKEIIKAAGTKQWKVAKILGVSEGTFLRWLRFELSPERKAAILAAVEKAKECGRE